MLTRRPSSTSQVSTFRLIFRHRWFRRHHRLGCEPVPQEHRRVRARRARHLCDIRHLGPGLEPAGAAQAEEDPLISGLLSEGLYLCLLRAHGREEPPSNLGKLLH